MLSFLRGDFLKKHKLLYKKIKDILDIYDLTITKISESTGISKQTISHRILNIKRRGIVDINLIEELEKITGEKIMDI